MSGYDPDSPEFALEKIRSGLMLMTMNAERLVGAADTLGNKDVQKVIGGLHDYLKVAKQYMATVEVEQVAESA